jgi:hypothetical protein
MILTADPITRTWTLITTTVSSVSASIFYVIVAQKLESLILPLNVGRPRQSSVFKKRPGAVVEESSNGDAEMGEVKDDTDPWCDLDNAGVTSVSAAPPPPPVEATTRADEYDNCAMRDAIPVQAPAPMSPTAATPVKENKSVADTKADQPKNLQTSGTIGAAMASPAPKKVPSYMRSTSSSARKSARKSRPEKEARGRSPSPGPAKRLSLTKPKSPEFKNRRRSCNNAPKESSTTAELNKIRDEMKKTKETKRKYDKFYQNHQGPNAKPSASTVRSAASLTIPADQMTTEPNKRVCKPKVIANSGKDQLCAVAQNHKHTLRSSMGSGSTAAPTLTHHKPFNLATSKRASVRRKGTGGGAGESTVATRLYEGGKTLAESVRAYSNRFATKSAVSETKNVPVTAGAPVLTIPQSPKLATRGRERSAPQASKLSTEQMEEKYVQQNHFKAKPINSKAMSSSGDLGVPKVQVKKNTIISEFKLSTDVRGKVNRRRSSCSNEPVPQQFKARGISTGVHRFKELEAKEQKKLTMPTSPKLATKMRAELAPRPVAAPEPEEEVKAFKARPIPAAVFDSTAAFVPNLESDKPLTVPVPFNMPGEQRHQQRMMESQVRKEQEDDDANRARQFVARPIVKGAPIQVQASEKELTEFQPFKLKGVELHEQAKCEKEQRMEEEKWQQKQDATFISQPIPASHVQSNLQIKKSTKALTQIDNVVLQADVRAVQRQHFNAQQKEKAARAAVARAEQMLRDEAEKQREIVRVRRDEMSYQAQPMLDGSPFKLRESNKQLTVPASPQLATKRRSSHRNSISHLR